MVNGIRCRSMLTNSPPQPDRIRSGMYDGFFHCATLSLVCQSARENQKACSSPWRSLTCRAMLFSDRLSTSNSIQTWLVDSMSSMIW